MLEGLEASTKSNANGISILDYGCGLGHFLEYLQTQSIYSKLHYEGCDASKKMIKHCQNKFGKDIFFKCSSDAELSNRPLYDYIVCNGVFTEKRDYTHQQMMIYTKNLLQRLSVKCSKGMMVNFMSKNVAWERDDLFHVSLDEITAFVTKNITRHFIVRSDYSLYDYTIYMFNSPFPCISTG